MSDSTITNGIVVREFRLDIGTHGESQLIDRVKAWLDRNGSSILKYCICFEISDVKKKPHLQGFLHVTKTCKFENLTREFKDIGKSDKAFAVAKNPSSLQKYSRKDGDIRLCNFSEQELEDMGTWEQREELTKKEKKISHREKFYKEFIEYCESHKDVDMGKYKLQWIGLRLFEYLGTQPLPEQIGWCKGVVFSAQAHLLKGTAEGVAKSAEEWVERMLY